MKTNNCIVRNMSILKKIFFSLVAVCSLIGLAACKKDEPTNSIPESSEFTFVDYVAETKLTQAVTGNSKFFGEDGIAYANLIRNVDGDTAIFRVDGREMTARFLGVDTPESTGQVEEWGKTASKFTANILDNAHQIVLQTNGGPAAADTTGTRYLTYVWYNTSANAQFRLLNLELVQEGLSYGKSATASRYASVLISAQSQAMAMKLKIFGTEKDPNYFYDGAIETTIKAIHEKRTEYIAASTKVKFDCTIVRNDGLYCYAQDYDAEDDITYAILLYKGYNLSTKKLEVGNRVSICGNVQEYDGQVQITSMQDIPLLESLENIQLLETNQEVKCLEVTPEMLDVSNTALNRNFVEMKNIAVTSVYTTTSGSSKGAVTITGTCAGVTVTLRTSVLYAAGSYELITEDYYKDKTLSVKGIVEIYNGSYQIHIVSIGDVEIIL